MNEDASPARRLRDALEPLAMHDIWSPAVQAMDARGYETFTAYVIARSAPLGDDVPLAVVVATFAAFAPDLIDKHLTAGRRLLPAGELLALRERATIASLRDVLGAGAEDEVERVGDLLGRAVAGIDGVGRPLFSALRSRPRLDDPFGRLWRAADLVREHRGDGNVAASVAAGLDAVRMNVLTEIWVGYPVGEYSGTRDWPQEALDAAAARLEADGLLAGGAITDAGRAARDAIEATTDRTQDTLVAALGTELTGVTEALERWSQRCVDAGAFPDDTRKRAAG